MAQRLLGSGIYNNQIGSSMGAFQRGTNDGNQSYSTIIRSAIKSTIKHYGNQASQEQFERVYDYKLQRHSLDPANPAFRKAENPLTNRKPWVVDHERELQRSQAIRNKFVGTMLKLNEENKNKK